MKSILIAVAVAFSNALVAQVNSFSGKVLDAQNREPLAGVSITIYEGFDVRGSVSNKEGAFFVKTVGPIDSVKFSMIGYRSRVYKIRGLSDDLKDTVMMQTESTVLQEVVVHPMGAMDIVQQAARKILLTIPSKDFESEGFYREIIRDKARYYSVAEAVFNIQFFVREKSFKMQLEKGRTKEDVAYTRLFEDFHPGGGPEEAVGQNLITHIPDFLNLSRLKNYTYIKDSAVMRDGHFIYVISFDQQPDVHQALEKGKMYIDADDFNLLHFQAENSERGMLYLKSLRGNDKIFAEILHIDFTIKGWARTAAYSAIGDKLFLSYAKMDHYIAYKQPGKDLNLDLAINTEFLVTDFQRPILKVISKGEEFKQKDLVANLPSEFDSTYWGNSNILSPAAELRTIMDSISRRNKDLPVSADLHGWQSFNRNYFSAYVNSDSITIVAVGKCAWEDDETGGMIFKDLQGDFSIEARLCIKKRTNIAEEPDNGFQQAGLIVRDEPKNKENNFIFSLGTGGNSKPKYFIKRTFQGKTKGVPDKIDSLTGWLKMQKVGNQLSLFRKDAENSDWMKVDDYELDWLKDNLQVGFSIMSRFAGDGPKQHPDMKAIFSNVKISRL
jgi:hypothetical protein